MTPTQKFGVELEAENRRKDFKIATTIQVVEIMLIEAQNEQVKNKVLDRMLNRLNLLRADPQTTKALAQNQARIKMVDQTIKQLEDIHSYEFAEQKKNVHNVVEDLKSTQNAAPI